MDTLEISFYGPLFYDLRKDPIEIFAPKCVGHKAGIFGPQNECPLHFRQRGGKDRVYFFTGPVFSVTSPLPVPIVNPALVLTSNALSAPTPPPPPVLVDAGFCLKVPVPKQIYAISPADVQVVKAGNIPNQPLVSKATALRFYYDADLSREFVLAFGTITDVVRHFGFDPFLRSLSRADIQFRIAASTPDDTDHVDSEECFGHIANLSGVDCSLSHEDIANPGGISASFARAGNDCRAPIMALTP